jgi:hypothetical protein
VNSRTLRSRFRDVKNEAGLTFTGTYGFQMIRRTSIVCLEVLCGILVVLGLLAAGSAWRLSQGPLSIQFLLPYAEDLLQRQDTRFRAELDDLILTWAGWERALDVRALGVRLVEKDAVRPVARIREVSVTLSVRALAEGKIAPTSLEIIRPRIRLIRYESGAFELDMGDPPAQAESQAETRPDSPPDATPGTQPDTQQVTQQVTGAGSNANVLTLLLNELSGPAQTESSLRYLNRVSVIGAALRLEDRQLGINWGARHADITVERALVGLRAAFDLDIDLQTSRPELHGKATFERSAERIDVKFDFARVNASQLGDQFAALAGLKALTAEFSGSGNLRVGLDGDIQRAEFALNSGQGSFIAPGVTAPPYAFKTLAIDGRLNRNPDQIQIARAAVDFGSTKAILAGVVTRVGAVAAVNATVTIPSMPADDLKKFWPPDAANGARAWVTANMRDGVYRDTTASLTARIPIDGKNAGNVTVDSINGRMNISGVTIDYLNPMPPLKNVVATATFSDSRLDFAVQGGNVGDLVLDGGTVAISGFRSGSDTLALTAIIRGPVRSALDIVAHPRLNLLSKVGLKTDGAAGTHTTRLELQIPLIKNLKAEEVRVKSVSDITGLALADIVKSRGVTDGTVALSIDNDAMTAKGTALYAGTEADFEWQQDFTGSNNVERRIAAKATVDAGMREIFDVFMRDRIEGPVPINFIYEERRDKTETFSAGLNLTDAKFSLPGFEWEKPAGTEATAEIAVLLSDGKIMALPQFRIDAGEFRVAGKGTFSPGAPENAANGGDAAGNNGGDAAGNNDGDAAGNNDGDAAGNNDGDAAGNNDGDAAGNPVVETLDIDRFILGNTSFSATVRRAADRSFTIDVSGGGFDAAPFISQDLGGIDAPDLPALSLTGTFGRLWVGPAAPTSNVRMELKRDSTRWERIVVEGALPDGGKAISIKMLPTPEGHILEIYSADAGWLLKAMDVTDSIRTGIIEINGVRKGGPNAPWRGIAEMKRFRVADAPNFARLLTLASLTGINDAISGKGIRFSRLRFPYVFENEVATITEARAVGSELGITATGRVDFGKDAIDIDGTVIPAYTINSLLGQIPVIGTILTGEKGGGIFAASYKISGPVEKPKISVNPLSALAPGFLRKLLDGGGSSPTDGETPDQEERPDRQKSR